ncbi:MAG: pyruvate formate lyase family protein, partial [Clostridiales bacterium]|nr:pyruvate formate lyase family protein [Clostridiales bacterium]
MRLARLLDCEKPFILRDDRFGFNRTVKNIPACNNAGDVAYWPTGNNTPDYMRVMRCGIGGILDEIRERKAKTNDGKKTDFYESLEISLNALLRLAARYREAAKESSPELYRALCTVPEKPATTFYEACVFLKILCFALRLNYTFHVTIGRFDQYMYGYYLHDKAAGVSDDELMEVLEEFFVTMNVDTDLYPGIQQGDNGQSIVLGGCDADGKNAYNPLSFMCLDTSLELNLIDPKINLRINKDTPIELYEKGTELTKQGMGFPQYSNDDIVIPGLTALGYDERDARDYSVAACWEFLIPGKGMDISNIRTVSFPRVVSDTVGASLCECDTFEQLMGEFEKHLGTELDRLLEMANSKVLEPSPFASLFITGCLEEGRDATEGVAKYNNYGFHGAGIANAADALAALKLLVYDNCEYTREETVAALEANFEGYEVLRNRMRDCPKMGNDEELADTIANRIMTVFSDLLKGKRNKFGGVIRPGTGSACDYIY